MANPFSGRVVPISGPATDIVPVTPSDTVDLSDVAVALYVAGAGVVVVDTIAGTAPRAVPVTANMLLPVGVKRVRATGTTAAGIFALVIN